MNVNIEKLEKIHGKDKAESVFREIADLGGFGAVGNAEGNISAAYAGGLDIGGVLDPGNSAVSDKAKDKIASLSGISRKEVETHTPESSAKK